MSLLSCTTAAVGFEAVFAPRYRLRGILKASPSLNLKWTRHASTTAAAGFSRIFVKSSWVHCLPALSSDGLWSVCSNCAATPSPDLSQTSPSPLVLCLSCGWSSAGCSGPTRRMCREWLRIVAASELVSRLLTRSTTVSSAETALGSFEASSKAGILW